jgi:hypothetical protein
MAQALPAGITQAANHNNNNNNNNDLSEELHSKQVEEALATCSGGTGFCSSGRCLCSGFCEGTCQWYDCGPC